MKVKPEEIDEAELSVFKKNLKKMEQFRGRGTELISVYIPNAADRGSVMGQLTEELSQSSNIKSPQTRKNVQGALRKISAFLKSINFKIPVHGLVVFAGNVSESEGKSDIRLFTVHPPKDLKTKLYWCDSTFHLEPLKDMAKTTDIYAILVLDKREATVAVLTGKKYQVVGHFTSMVAGKSRVGGQSSVRFEHLREEAAKDFFKKVSEKTNQIFSEYQDKLKGMVIGGPGRTKHEFLERELLDYRLKEKIMGILDNSYTDESGIREIVQKSDELLKDAEITRERGTVNKFFETVVKEGMATYGQKEVEDALSIGKASELLVSEGIEWIVIKKRCEKCEKDEEKIIKNPLEYDESKERCATCGGPIEILEQIDYVDWILEKAKTSGAETHVISMDTPEGQTFYKGFGGLGAHLRYK
jgi:peptide chain release factor subunit 1